MPGLPPRKAHQRQPQPTQPCRRFVRARRQLESRARPANQEGLQRPHFAGLTSPGEVWPVLAGEGTRGPPRVCGLWRTQERVRAMNQREVGLECQGSAQGAAAQKPPFPGLCKSLKTKSGFYALWSASKTNDFWAGRAHFSLEPARFTWLDGSQQSAEVRPQISPLPAAVFFVRSIAETQGL